MMRRCAFFLIGLVFLTSGAILWAEDPETKVETKVETKPRGTLKIGVINMTKVFSEYQKRADGRVELEKQRSEMQAEIKKKEKKLQKLEQELEILSGEERLKKQAEYKEKAASYKAYFKVNSGELHRRQCDLWKSIYNEIITEVKRSAEQEGYDIVLKIDDGPVSGSSLENIQLNVDIKKILFHSPKVDMTDGIINVLNEKYKRVKESKEKNS